jgi:cytochrome c peroxidase
MDLPHHPHKLASDFRKKSNYATMRFDSEASHGANNGLHVARGIMEEIKKEFDWISYGDLWTLGGVAAVQVCL